MEPEFLDELQNYKKTWSGKYKHIQFSIVFHTAPYMKEDEYDMYPNKGIWNSYILIDKKAIPKEFNNIFPEYVKSKRWSHYDYSSLGWLFGMNGGLTYFQPQRDDEGNLMGFKVGNDYAHSWNGYEDLKSILHDVKKSIDTFIENFPKYKAWSIIDGKWIIASNVEKYNEKARQKMKEKQK